eukprot:6492280-Amphidinium_carterae.6
MRSVVRTSSFYSFSADRLVAAEEVMQCLGFPAEKFALQGLSESQLKDLIGEAFAVPCATLVCMVMAGYCDIWRSSDGCPFDD